MDTPALIMMITTQVVVFSITVYFFWRVLSTPPKTEPDSYTDNDLDINM